jgi:hypothetical protein
MSVLEQEIIEKFHQLDKQAKQRVRALIERETEPVTAADEAEAVDAFGWPIGFFAETYGSLADDPLDEIDNSQLPPPVRDEVE